MEMQHAWGWSTYDRNFQVRDIPIHFISDINYCFLDLQPDPKTGFYVPVLMDPWADTDKPFTNPSDSVPPVDTDDDELPTTLPVGAKLLRGNLGQFAKLKRFANFNLGLSIGGWTNSTHFSDAVATHEARLAFVAGIQRLLDRFNNLISRIDLDWEHVSPPGENHGHPSNVTRPTDSENYAAFLLMLRASLDLNPSHRNVAITACASGNPPAILALPLATMSQVLQSINIMTYDFASSAFGPTVAGHHTNLFSTPYASSSVHLAVETFIKAGVPPHKLVIGVATYSRGFANTDGLGQPSNGVVSDSSFEPGVCDYKSLPRPGAKEIWDPKACATVSFDKSKRIINSYDTVESVREKCRYVWERGLGGIIVWETSGDCSPSHPRSLFSALYDGLSRDPRILPASVPQA
eukprot:jgi/Hompol1/4774/HPOL_003868-RA